MRAIIRRFSSWFLRARQAKRLVRLHLEQLHRPQFSTSIAYRVRSLIVVCGSYYDRALPLRTYHIVDTHTLSVTDVPWSEVRKLVPARKSFWC